MDHKQLILKMVFNEDRIRALVHGVSHQAARWRPSPDAWSILEVVNHLYDEEREDFRARLDIILHHPGRKWPPIDPQGWVTERAYNDRDLDASLQGFIEERRRSIAWLNSLEAPRWEAGYETSRGILTAGDMMASWVAHDLLHMRQIVEIHHAYVVEHVLPFDTGYAGPW